MGRKTHKTDFKLKELLEHKKEQASLDDFEREALEGFSFLEKEQEAFDLKTRLDECMEEAFAGVKKNRSASPYWLAAASLLLVVGISVYFMFLGNPVDKQDRQELALTTSPPQTKTQTEKTGPLHASQVEQMQPGSPGPAGKTVQTHQRKPVSGMSGQDKTDLAQVSPAPAASEQGDETKQLKESFAVNSRAEEEIAPAKNILPNTSEKKEMMRKDETWEGDKKAENRTAAPAKKMKASTPPMTNEVNRDMAAGLSNTPELNTGNCYYEGGSDDLQKEIARRLKQKKLDRHFEATLFINSTGKVAKVEFTNQENYSSQETKKVITVLQSLDKFRFLHQPGKGYLCEYKIVR